MPYNLKHRETGNLASGSQAPIEFDTPLEAAQGLIALFGAGSVFDFELVEVVKPLPTDVGIYAKRGDHGEIPVNLYCFNYSGTWAVLGPNGWQERRASTIPHDLVRLHAPNA